MQKQYQESGSSVFLFVPFCLECGWCRPRRHRVQGVSLTGWCCRSTRGPWPSQRRAGKFDEISWEFGIKIFNKNTPNRKWDSEMHTTSFFKNHQLRIRLGQVRWCWQLTLHRNFGSFHLCSKISSQLQVRLEIVFPAFSWGRARGLMFLPHLILKYKKQMLQSKKCSNNGLDVKNRLDEPFDHLTKVLQALIFQFPVLGVAQLLESGSKTFIRLSTSMSPPASLGISGMRFDPCLAHGNTYAKKRRACLINQILPRSAGWQFLPMKIWVQLPWRKFSNQNLLKLNAWNIMKSVTATKMNMQTGWVLKTTNP